MFASAANQNKAAGHLGLVGPQYDLSRDPGTAMIDLAAFYLEKGMPMTVSFNTGLPTEFMLSDDQLVRLAIQLNMQKLRM